MDDYFAAITGNRESGVRAAFIKTAQRSNIQRVLEQLNQSKLFSAELWGYGINSISDGIEVHASVDVEDFKKIQGLNKHHHDQRLLWLLTFKIDGDSLYVSVFCLDTARASVNSNLNTKYHLKDFQNARIRTRGNTIYVDLVFDKLEKPIHFQIDSIAQGGKLYGQELAEYYIKQITEKAEIVKASHKAAEKIVNQHKSLEDVLDETEKKLRYFFVTVLEKETGKKDYQEILTGKHKQDLKRRISLHLEKHPAESIDDYKLLRYAIEFSDIEHLKQTILKEANWKYFEPFFKNKAFTEKYFDQFGHLRHTLKHSRKLTDLVKHEGMAAIEWFKQTIK